MSGYRPEYSSGSDQLLTILTMIITSTVTSFETTTIPNHPGIKLPWADDSWAVQQQRPKAAFAEDLFQHRPCS